MKRVRRRPRGRSPVAKRIERQLRSVLRRAKKRGATWPVHRFSHEHFFSPLCRDEVHGRFDAIEDASGCYVLDVGAQKVVRRCHTRAGAVRSAQAAAKRWRPSLNR